MSTIPEHIRKLLANADIAKTNEMALSVSVPRISTKGNRFKALNGDIETKLGDDFFGIIVGISPEGLSKAKTFYEGGWTEDSHEAPNCSSATGVIPDEWIAEPIHKVCATCPKNQWGSAESKDGKKAKACKEAKVLHIVLATDVEVDDPIVYVMNVTVNSFKNFTTYGTSLAKAGLDSPFYVITKFILDEESSVPRVQFENVGFLDEAPMLKLLPIAEAKPWAMANRQALLAAPARQEAIAYAAAPVSNRPGCLGQVVNASTGKPADVTPTQVGDLLDKW